MVSRRSNGVRFNLIFLPAGLRIFKPTEAAPSAEPELLIASVVVDIDAEYERLRTERVPIMTPVETEDWGEHSFQMRDASGMTYQLAQRISPPPAY